MGVALPRSPQLQLVNSLGNLIEGPYNLSVPSGAPTTLGLSLDTVDSTIEAVDVGPWTNLNWQVMSYVVGYRLHANLKFSEVQCDPSSLVYGLTLLQRLWQAGQDNQISYGALQFRMFASSTWRTVRPSSRELRPFLLAGKQGFFGLEMPLETRDLVAVPGWWAQAAW